MYFVKMIIIFILFLKVWIVNKNVYVKRMFVYVFILRFIIGNSILILFRFNEKNCWLINVFFKDCIFYIIIIFFCLYFLF